MTERQKLKIPPATGIGLIFVLGICVRLYHLGTPGFCDDEIYTAIRISHPLLTTIALLGHTQFPPLHYIILHLWTGVFGNGEWALRFPSVVFSSLTIIVIYKLGRELMSEGVGLTAAFLLAFSPFAVNYAQNAKMYALFWLLTAASFLFFFRYLKDQKDSSYSAYIFTSILSCYTLFTGFLFLITQSMIFLLTGPRTGLKKWFTGQLIVVGFCLPWIIYFSSLPHELFYLRPYNVPFNYLAFFFKSLLGIIGNSDHGFWQPNCSFYIFLVTYLAVDVWENLQKKKINSGSFMHYCGLFLWLSLPVIIYFLFDYLGPRVKLSYRYVGFLQVPLILWVSCSICNYRGLLKTILVLVIGLMAVNNTYIYFKDDLRSPPVVWSDTAVVMAMNGSYKYFHDNLTFPQEDWHTTAKEIGNEPWQKNLALSFVELTLFKYYDKTATARYSMIPEKDFSSEFLESKGVLRRSIRNIFILYKDRSAPDVHLNGFFLDHKVQRGQSGLVCYQRKNQNGFW